VTAEQQALEARIVAEAGRLLGPHDDWVTARFIVAEVGSMGTMVSRFTRADGSLGSMRVRGQFQDLWEQLREVMADPERGAWFSASLDVDRASGSSSFSYNWDGRVWFDRLIPDLDPSDVDLALPLDEAWGEELARHPRSPEHVPAWLRALVAGEVTERQPGDGAAVERAIAAAPTWPPARASLASSARWSEVFDAVSEEIVRALRADTPATELLHSEVDDRALEQVAAAATGPLLRRFVHDTASCAALAAELDTPNGPDRAEDDVTDAITDIVDWQIARRFDQ